MYDSIVVVVAVDVKDVTFLVTDYYYWTKAEFSIFF